MRLRSKAFGIILVIGTYIIRLFRLPEWVCMILNIT